MESVRKMSRNRRNVVEANSDDLHLFSHVLKGNHDYDWLLTPPGSPLFPSSKVSITQSDHMNHSRSSSTNNSRLSILNTSSSSLSSYIRPSSPSKPRSPASWSRPAASQSSRPATPTPRPVASQPSRPATPTPRPAGSQPSRPATPTTRRNSMPSPSTSPALNARNSSRPSSPTPRPHPIGPQQTPPNLRTSLPNRPLSAGRSRPSPNSETQPSSLTNISRRHSSPIVSRGRLTEPKTHHLEVGPRRSVKSSSSTSVTDNTAGFGRTISKKSLDVAIKHMDIRNSSGNLRALSSTTLFPQSIRSSASPNPKSQSHQASSAPASNNINGRSLVSSKNRVAVGNDMKRNMMINGRREVLDERQQHSAKLSKVVDIYESSRYDALLLKEDLKNTYWLHSADDKCDQDSIFGHGFEHLPEPFGLL